MTDEELKALQEYAQGMADDMTARLDKFHAELREFLEARFKYEWADRLVGSTVMILLAATYVADMALLDGKPLAGPLELAVSLMRQAATVQHRYGAGDEFGTRPAGPRGMQ